ncbi:MAG: hypothetical protein Q9172_005424 [Xanthocarpia lactea]
MASADEQLKRLTDPSLLDKIDGLRELNISEYIPLPQLVVVGDQSSGKSSVLEGLTDLPFPRDSGLCTRFVTQITFRRAEKSSVIVSIIPSPAADTTTKGKLNAFIIDDLTLLSGDEFITVLSKACNAMGIPAPGQPLVPGRSTFSDDILKIELSGPSRQHLSIIDVPGIFRTPTEGVTTKEDMARVQHMVKSYIKDPRTIILAVVPAPVDIATQEILSMAEEADPLGQRTLGVLTKPDLVDRGAEEHVIDLVRGTRNKLTLGYCMVRNRGQQDKSLSSTSRHDKEKQFFDNAPWSTLDRDRVGIPALQDRLRDLLVDITRQEFPKVKHEVDKRLLACEQKLKFLGPARETDDQQRTLLLDLAAKSQEITSHALDAYYHRSSLFRDHPSLRLATRIVDLHSTFSTDVWLKGHTLHFSKSTMRKGNESAAGPSDDTNSAAEPPTNAEPSPTMDIPESTSEINEPEDPKFSELSDVIQGPWRCPAPKQENIFDRIESMYRNSRGFELGTFDPSLLPIIFQQQSKKWDGLALAYISDVIRVVHSFLKDLLSALCLDARVRSNLLASINDELLERYKKAISHTKFILSVERNGTLLTTNHYFNDNLQKARVERLQNALKGQVSDIKFSSGNRKMVSVDAVISSVPMGNIEHMVEDIHAILKSYYKVARKRFVDVVCMQAADHFLVTGPDSPLRLFTPSFVHRLSLDSLNLIAGEDAVSKRTRNVLNHEMKCLKAGKKLLRG